MDHTSSEEGKQPAKENGIPSQFSAGDDRGTSARSEQDRDSESSRRAFDLLERFSGELEEILRSLERARSNTTSAENSPQAPEQAFSPSSIHFDPSPISGRIDPNALPPVKSPGVVSRSTPRLTLEAVFLILVAAISARTGLRPLLVVVAEAAAFLIVVSIELAIARDRRHYRQFPASAPTFASLLVQETGATSEPLSVALDQVEPLVWQADRQEDAAEANWPLAEFEPRSEPDEAEDIDEAQEGATEISTALHAEGGVVAAPVPALEVRSEAASESSMEIPTAENETETETESTAEIFAAEAEPEHQRRFGLFRHETSEPSSAAEPEVESEPEVETSAEAEAEPETGSEVQLESTAEIFAAEAEPEHQRRFGLFRHETTEPGSEAEPEAEIEPEVEAEALDSTTTEFETETDHHGHSHRFGRKEKTPEAETEAESTAEIPAAEAEPEHQRRFGLFRHEAREPGSEAEPEVEIEPEVETDAEAKAEPETGSEVQLESTAEIFAAEAEPEHQRRFGLFRHETSEPSSAAEPEVESEPEVEAEAPNGERTPLGDSFSQRSDEEPGSSADVGDTTIEIDLPPEIPIAEIERTLEALGGHEPGLRRRRWPRGAGTEKGAAEQSTDNETPSGESDLRLTAELERRRREREYLRNVRAPR